MIIFDTETTGLKKVSIVPLDQQPKIIEFAAIKLDDKSLKEVDRFEFLCNPQEMISKEITKITRLTNEDLAHQKPFGHYYDALNNFFKNEKYIFAHNISFDIGLLKFELRRIDKLKEFTFPKIQICTVVNTMKLLGYRLNLTKLHEYLFGVGFEEAHRAMHDVEALTRCVVELINRKYILL